MENLTLVKSNKTNELYLYMPERDKADLSRHLDTRSMCGLLKLYLRLLPQPLITSDIFQRFLNANGKW